MVHPKEEARVRVQVDVVKVKESLLIPKLLILIRINTLYLIVNINTILRVIARGLQYHQYCEGEGGEGVGGHEGAGPQEGVEEREHEGEVGAHLGAQDRRGQQDRTWGEQGGKFFSWTFLQQFAQVAMFSPAAKAGILPGNTLVLINDWKVEAMEQVGKSKIPQYQVTCWSG